MNMYDAIGKGFALVRADEDLGTLLIWRGGHTVNVWAPDAVAGEWECCECYTIGYMSKDEATIEEVKESMGEHLGFLRRSLLSDC